MKELQALIEAERKAAAAAFNVFWTEGAVAATKYDLEYNRAKAAVDEMVEQLGG